MTVTELLIAMMSLSVVRVSFWTCLLLPVYGVVPLPHAEVDYSTEAPVKTDGLLAKGTYYPEPSVYTSPSKAGDRNDGVICYYYRWDHCEKAKENSTESDDRHIPECVMQEIQCERLCEAQAVIENDNTTVLTAAHCGDRNSFAISSGTCETSKLVGDNNVFVCVCDGHLCNRDARYLYRSPSTPAVHGYGLQSEQQGLNLVATFVSAAIVVLVIVLLILAICFWKLYRASQLPRRIGYKDTIAESTSSSNHSDSESYSLNEICMSALNTEKLDIDLDKLVPLTKGKFGVISLLQDQIDGMQCILKSMTAENKASWEQEKTILAQPGMSHENIIRYIGHLCKDATYSIILQYHPNGSLFTYLKGNTVSWAELLRISHGMMRGLAHLHELMLYKYPVAHRDIKSENIILDHNLTAKITDFNLAKMLPCSMLSSNDINLQVGTTRYMSPELLKCIIGTTRDSMLKSDIYAMSYVMWEVLHRCECYSPASLEYMMPLEDLVGRDPSIATMYKVVAEQQKRPQFKSSPLNEYSEDVEEITCMIEGCWEEEWEHRFSAANVESKLHTLVQQQGQTSKLLVDADVVPNIVYSSTESLPVSNSTIARHSDLGNSYSSVSNSDNNSNFNKLVGCSNELADTSIVYYV